MRLRFILGMAVALMAVATVASAYPNLSATTGLVGVPNANVVAPGALTGAADVLFFNDTIVNARAIYGMTRGLEVGAGAVIGDDTGLILNAKYGLPIAAAGFNLAAGLSYQAADESGNGFQLYFVGTRPFLGTAENATVLGTLGLTFTDLEDATALRPFVGAQWLVSARTELGAEFELEAGDFEESIFSVYVRQNLAGPWSGQLGLTNANGFIGDDSHEFFAGASYAFGG